MFKKKKKSHVSLELNDYVLRGLVVKGPNIEDWQVVELPLSEGMVEGAMINDEMALFELVKENLAKLGGKKQDVRIFVPDTSVLLKTFEHPDTIKSEKLLEYVQMELGRSIHLPFKDPLVDIYDHEQDDGQAVLFAVPPEEVGKWMGILLDTQLNPVTADIRSLSNLRLLQQMNKIDEERTYLVSAWSINELSICIYSTGQVEFLRFQNIETDMAKWIAMETETGLQFKYDGDIQDYRLQVTDQVLELDRIMNFFRFSLYKGEKSVEEVIIMGDNPLLQSISEFLLDNITVPITVIDDAAIQEFYPQFEAKHASLLGLALKEVD